eukprot:364003-Chlamydomonas_euryale.AAC.6
MPLAGVTTRVAGSGERTWPAEGVGVLSLGRPRAVGLYCSDAGATPGRRCGDGVGSSAPLPSAWTGNAEWPNPANGRCRCGEYTAPAAAVPPAPPSAGGRTGPNPGKSGDCSADSARDGCGARPAGHPACVVRAAMAAGNKASDAHCGLGADKMAAAGERRWAASTG